MNLVFALWILGAGQAATAAPPPTDKASAVADARQKRPSTAALAQKKMTVPSMAMLGFLGDFGDAADGLDPMSLAEHPEVTLKKDKVEHKP